MAVGDTRKFQVEGRLEGQQIITDWYYRVFIEGTPPSSDTDLIAAWERLVKTPYLTALCSSYTILQYNISRVDPNPNISIAYAPTLPAMGTQPGDSLPGTVAQVTTKRTGIPGRAFRGRFYFAGIAEADAVIGTLNPTAKGRFDSLAAALSLVINSLGGTTTYEPVLRHHAPGSQGTGPVSYTLLLSHLARSILANQRRRRPGVGS